MVSYLLYNRDCKMFSNDTVNCSRIIFRISYGPRFYSSSGIARIMQSRTVGSSSPRTFHGTRTGSGLLTAGGQRRTESTPPDVAFRGRGVPAEARTIPNLTRFAIASSADGR